jgi:DNA-directed RNA polymerase subunit omega
MLDIELEEELIRKVGGKFKLTALMQKRMVELNRGAPALVKLDSEERTTRRVVCQEILQGKIELAPRDEVGYTFEEEKARIQTEAVAAPEPSSAAEVYGSDIKKIKEQRIKELSQLLNPKK